MKEALQQAHDQLERSVAERTADLVAANEQLAREIVERQRAELVLRKAQDALIHAGKMAVLGQMSAGITHELNQPLAALRTLSDNARLLLANDRRDDVQKNLTLISQLTERMGKITGQLKAFARKTPLQLGRVSLRRALGNVQALLEQRLRTEQVVLTQDLAADDVEVWAEANRLEQVLVNLVVNALDAMQRGIAAARGGGRARARRSGFDRGSRHGFGNRGRFSAAVVRAVRHDEGARRGTWAGTRDFIGHHR